MNKSVKGLVLSSTGTMKRGASSPACYAPYVGELVVHRLGLSRAFAEEISPIILCEVHENHLSAFLELRLKGRRTQWRRGGARGECGKFVE